MTRIITFAIILPVVDGFLRITVAVGKVVMGLIWLSGADGVKRLNLAATGSLGIVCFLLLTVYLAWLSLVALTLGWPVG
ncbi:hypothetical protein DPMN_085539 [Dreissena polymorpha]|uniref:Uncharacterized protein n=1 Tax=Dreissena polymorpha TaxID=45954 RepID=A0A9D3YG98_DREPO|nr:hypothetical protein DPMN_085539 [Dreissena polymorpha]